MKIVTRCRYCGQNYSYKEKDPGSCLRKECVKKLKTDAFVTKKTSTGTTITPIEFNFDSKPKQTIQEIKIKSTKKGA